MKLLLDEDSSGALLAKLLRTAEHDVQSSLELGTTSDPDPAQLIHAIGHDRVLMSRNHGDFKLLHELIMTASGHHPGIVITRFDNDSTRDFSPRDIVLALSKLESSGLQFAMRFTS